MTSANHSLDNPGDARGHVQPLRIDRHGTVATPSAASILRVIG